MRHRSRYETQPDGSVLKFRRVNGGWQRWLRWATGEGWSRFARYYRPAPCQEYERP